MPYMDFPSHVQWLVKHRDRALADALVRENTGTDVEQALGILMDADPSVKKLAVQWLVDTYIRGGFRWEDVHAGKESKAAHTLRLFGLNRRLLEGNARNLGSYTSLGQVYAAIRPFDITAADAETEVTPGSRALRRAEREAVMAESRVVYRDEMMIVAVPLSERASKWWGRGTQWCTAADKNSAFMDYHQKAPLIVMVFPKGMDGRSAVRKLQLYVDEKDFQFMDENDEQVSSEFISENRHHLDGILEWWLGRNGKSLNFILKEHRYKHLCFKAVVQNGLALQFVPKQYRSENLCLEAVKQNGWALNYVPEEYRSENLCLEAVKQNGWALNYVPEEYRSNILCLEAVRQNGLSIPFVPDKYCDENLCMEAVTQNGKALKYVPDKHRSKALYLEAVKQTGMALRFVPEKHQDSDLCHTAISQNGKALKYIPEQYCSENLCLEAVKHNGLALKYIPPEHLSEVLCLEAVKKTGNALADVPTKYCREALCIEAVKQNGYALYYVPFKYRSKAVCLEAVRQSGLALQFVPKQYRSENLCLEAVKRDIRALYFVPDKLKNDALRCEAEKQIPDSHKIKWNPEETLKELSEIIMRVKNKERSDNANT